MMCVVVPFFSVCDDFTCDIFYVYALLCMCGCVCLFVCIVYKIGFNVECRLSVCVVCLSVLPVLFYVCYTCL